MQQHVTEKWRKKKKKEQHTDWKRVLIVCPADRQTTTDTNVFININKKTTIFLMQLHFYWAVGTKCS